ncbi:MAG: hypothetical protein ACE364_05010 [Chlorobiota bacterium]
MKKTLIILALVLSFGCSSNRTIETDDSLLFTNYEELEGEYIMYSFSHYSIGYPSKPVPKFVTQYLLIKKYSEKYDYNYFEVYKYSNYSKMEKMRNIGEGEYKNIIHYVDSLKSNTVPECVKTGDYSFLLNFFFSININGFKLETSMWELMPHEIELFHKLTCLEEYLKMSFFFREYEATTRF